MKDKFHLTLTEDLSAREMVALLEQHDPNLTHHEALALIRESAMHNRWDHKRGVFPCTDARRSAL